MVNKRPQWSTKGKQWPTKGNNGQQKTNNGQQKATIVNKRPQWSTKCHHGQQNATMVNNMQTMVNKGRQWATKPLATMVNHGPPGSTPAPPGPPWSTKCNNGQQKAWARKRTQLTHNTPKCYDACGVVWRASAHKCYHICYCGSLGAQAHHLKQKETV